jgi:phosphoserine phosphatase RsbU/P
VQPSTIPMPSVWLVPVAGPPVEPIELSDGRGGLTLGRHEACDIRLPLSAEQVSRYHAKLTRDGHSTRIADLGSRWGTYVNGVKLEPNHDVALAEGDLIRVTPWTFSLSATPSRRGLTSAEDNGGGTIVRSIAPDRAGPLAQDMLALLLESAAAIHAADSEKALAERLIDAAVRGTGLMNAAVLRPIDQHGHYDIIGSRLGPNVERAGPGGFSQSLLSAAASGNVAEISGGVGGDISQSIVTMKINAAICVPLGRMASLALANLKRQEMEKRDAQMQAELTAAAQAQRWILPRRQVVHAPLSTIGESRPGQSVGGDFFDVIPLPGRRLAVTLGDVSGKGIAASVLMTAAAGFLHAAMADGGDLAASVLALNRFIYPRRPANKFVTLWAAILDPDGGTLTYVDAGHSYALLRRTDGTVQQLDEAGGLPIGIDEDESYTATTVPFAAGDGLTVVSDGIIEQFGLPRDGEEPEQFGVDGLKTSITAAPADPVEALFRAVIAHAGTDKLADDATAVWVR